MNLLRYSVVFIFGSVLYSLQSDYTEWVNATCLVLILLFGIPHGAVDHRIHLSTTSGKNVGAYILKYVLIAAAYILWWIFDPSKALFLFIMLSAYHFGQELLEDAKVENANGLENMVWGALILVAPMLYSFSEINSYLEIITNRSIPVPGSFVTFVIPSTLLVAAFLHLVYRYVKKAISKESLLRLSGFVVTLIVGHLFLPFVMAFTLYFVFFHSFNAFRHQFHWLRDRKENYSLKSFILDLSGFSLLSIFGIVLLLWLLNPANVDGLISYFFILTSLITLPHAITLDQFYKFRRTGFSGSHA